jgi:hypothetical protein
MTGNDCASQVAKVFGLTERRIPVHKQVLSFDMAKPLQLPEIGFEGPATVDSHSLGLFGVMDNRDAFYARRPSISLSVNRLCEAQGCGDRRTRYELPPSHVPSKDYTGREQSSTLS